MVEAHITLLLESSEQTMSGRGREACLLGEFGQSGSLALSLRDAI